MSSNSTTSYGNRYEADILDLLVNGEASFASIFRALIDIFGHPRSLSPNHLLDVLFDLERGGLLRAFRSTADGDRDFDVTDLPGIRTAYEEWLAGNESLSVSDTAFDEVGLWFALTPRGRRRWERGTG
jgi:hypothetical protein